MHIDFGVTFEQVCHVLWIDDLTSLQDCCCCFRVCIYTYMSDLLVGFERGRLCLHQRRCHLDLHVMLLMEWVYWEPKEHSGILVRSHYRYVCVCVVFSACAILILESNHC